MDRLIVDEDWNIVDTETGELLDIDQMFDLVNKLWKEKKESKEVFLILDDEPLTRRNITLVGTEDQAKAIVKDEEYMFYESVGLMSDKDIKDILCDKVLSEIDDWEKFYDTHCENCSLTYKEVCPYKNEG